MMQAQFGDDYYGEEDGEGLSLPENLEEGVDDKTDGEVEGQEEYDENEEEFDDGSAAYSNGTSTSQAQAISGMLDELYKLDYEDIVAGIPCRFKYRQVEKEDFGLTADEILLAEDAELNKFVSLKRISAYSEPYGAGEQAHKVTKKRKRLRVAIKERLEKEAADAAALGMEIKGLKNKNSSESEKEEKTIEEGVIAEDEGGKEDGTSKKRRRRKLKEERGALPPTASVSKESTNIPPNGSKIKATVKKIKEIVSEAKASDITLTSNNMKDTAGSSSSSKKEKKSSGTDNGIEIPKKKKKTAMAPAPTAHKGANSKPKTMDENKKRRANLYK
jgi:protein KRI1